MKVPIIRKDNAAKTVWSEKNSGLNQKLFQVFQL